MVLWVILGVMAAGTALAVLRPLTARGERQPGREAFEAAVYRDQLEQIGRDVEVGVLAPAEAEAARAEIGRRFLAVREAVPENAGPARTRLPEAASIAAVLFVPLVSLALYAALGSPNLPSAPASGRSEAQLEEQTVEQLIARVQTHLRSNPNDARGWEVLTTPLLRLGRFEDAAAAYRRVIRLDGATAPRLAGLGEALTFANGGIVSTEARAAFAQAVELDGTLPRPHYYLGLSARQDGDTDKAISIWTSLVASAPADAPWKRDIEARIVEAGGSLAPGPSAEDVAAAAGLNEAERRQMVAGMVARLDARLAEQGGTPEEWLRLVGAYRVIGDDDARRRTIDRARTALADDDAALASFEAGLGPE